MENKIKGKLETLKEKLSDPVVKEAVKQVAISVGTAIVVSLAVNAITYIAVEGTKSLVEEVKVRLNPIEEANIEITE